MKKLSVILFIFILVFITFGCAEKTATQNFTSTENNVSTQVEEVYQDGDWGNEFRKQINLLQADLDAVSLSEQYDDYDNLLIAGQNLVNDTEIAVSVNSNYTVSPKYRDAQKELDLALKDLNVAGQAIIRAGEAGKTGKNTSDYELEENKYIISGTNHIGRAAAYLNNTYVGSNEN